MRENVNYTYNVVPMAHFVKVENGFIVYSHKNNGDEEVTYSIPVEESKGLPLTQTIDSRIINKWLIETPVIVDGDTQSNTEEVLESEIIE